ncbi:MAG: dTDP-4-dehydrorhamnose 3,5-epimerase [Candidatus Rokuibacteriota bacterium]
MIFTEVKLPGAYIVDVERREDSRGFFARTFCARELEARGLETLVVQCNVSYNLKRGTLRGLHYQIPPSAEAKVIRCTSGAIYDVIVDVRPTSPTYLQHVAVELTAENHRALYLPEGFAHGYQTLSDGAELAYQMSEFYAPALERGLRYDDPVLDIRWPLPVAEISEKDRSWPLLPMPVATPAPAAEAD